MQSVLVDSGHAIHYCPREVCHSHHHQLITTQTMSTSVCVRDRRPQHTSYLLPLLGLFASQNVEFATSFVFDRTCKSEMPILMLPKQKVNSALADLAFSAVILECLLFPAKSGAVPLDPSIISNNSEINIENRVETIITTKLADTEAFQTLRRELPTTKAIRELNDLKDLQDSRLDACVDRGIFWEQCFMFGENDGQIAQKDGSNPRNGMDYQLISPTGALDPGNMAKSPKTKIPTW